MKIVEILTYFIIFFIIFLPIIYLFFSVFLSKIVLNQMKEFFTQFPKRIGPIFIRSIIIGILTSIVSTMIGTSLSILFECTNLSRKRILFFLLFLPFLIPAFITTFSWIVLEHRALKLIPFNINSEAGVIFFLSLSFFPIPLLITSLGIRSLDSSYVEAGIILNKRKIKIIQKIILPLIKPHIIISMFLVFFLTLSEYTVPAFLMVNTYQNEIFMQFAAFYSFEGAVVYSIPLLIQSLILTLLICLYLKNKSFTAITSFKKEWKYFIELGKWKIVVFAFIFLILLFSIFIPFFILLKESELKILQALSQSSKSIIYSLEITTISSILLSILGFLSSYSFKNSKMIIPILSFPIALSSPIIGTALISMYSNLPLPIYGTHVILIMGYLMKFIPFSLFIFSSFMTQISSSIEEAGIIFTRSQTKIIGKILIPLLKQAFFSTFVIMFIFIFGEIGITQLLSPPGFQTLPQRIEVIMHYGDYETVASLSLILYSLIFLFSIIYVKMFKVHEY
ncbi:MAG: hypothetical protein QW641_02510 [Candidatus Aenigmatarchaeota archaeon]